MFSIQPIQKDHFRLTLNHLQEGIASQVSPGFVCGFWSHRHSGSFWGTAMGSRRIEPSVQPIEIGTPFDVASLTKVMGTAPLIALLVDRSWIRWNDPVKKFFPDYPYSDITLYHLLTHTSGYPAWKPYYEKFHTKFGVDKIATISVEERQELMRHLVLSTEVEAQPEEQCVYSDLSFLILGFIIEEILNQPLDIAIQKNIWNSMRLKNTYFKRTNRPILDLQDELVAATEKCPWRNVVLQGQVHDDNAWCMGGYGGHAGAFSTLENIFCFVEALFSNFLSQSILKEMWSPHPKFPRTLGWDCPTAKSSSGNFFSKNSVGHLGFTGVSIWIDIDRAFAVVLLSNRVHPSRENVKIKEFRPLFHNILMKDLRFS